VFEKRTDKAARSSATTCRDTPPEDDTSVTAGLLAHGSSLLPAFPVKSSPVASNQQRHRRLQLRGQLRLGPFTGFTEFPLSSGYGDPKNHDPYIWWGRS